MSAFPPGRIVLASRIRFDGDDGPLGHGWGSSGWRAALLTARLPFAGILLSIVLRPRLYLNRSPFRNGGISIAGRRQVFGRSRRLEASSPLKVAGCGGRFRAQPGERGFFAMAFGRWRASLGRRLWRRKARVSRSGGNARHPGLAKPKAASRNFAIFSVPTNRVETKLVQ